MCGSPSCGYPLLVGLTDVGPSFFVSRGRSSLKIKYSCSLPSLESSLYSEPSAVSSTRSLSKCKVPEVVRVIRGETMSPVSLLLWAPYLVVEDVSRCPRALESLLAARCSPYLHGSPARAPLSIAVASNDLESVEELLAHRAHPDIASDGEEPPLCAAVRHRRRGIVSALLEHIGPTRTSARCLPLDLLQWDTLNRASHRWNWL